MRVLFVNRADADERFGGDTVQMRETARALRRAGVEVEERLGPQPPEVYRGFDVVHLFNLQTPAFTVAEAEKVKASGRKLAVSTIFWDFGAELLVAESRLWGRVASLTGRPIALKLAHRRVNSVAALDRGQMRRILELADISLPNSQAEVDHLRRLVPKLGRVQVVPNGIDAARFDPDRPLPLPGWARERGISSGGYVLVAARIDPHKNQIPFCQAMRGWEHPIVLSGQAADPAWIRECEDAGAVYVGSLSGDDLVAAYRHAKVHALPSFRETPGLSSLEAAAMGCAIVSTEAGSAREFFGDEAVYCDPRSAASMRGAVEMAWAAGAPQGLAGRVRRRFTWDAAAAATLAAYQSILS
ncbi:MAG: glycosyltransferase family 4 protein [Fimbriimonas sp.]